MVRRILLLLAAVCWAAQSRTILSLSALDSSYSTDDADAASSSGPNHRQYQYFPNSQIVMDMVILSGSVYQLRNKGVSCHDQNSAEKLVLPEGSKCLHYSHDLVLGTQVLVVRSTLHNYVAVSYAGTNDLTTFSADGNAILSDFGPTLTMVGDENTENTTGDGGNFMSIFKDVPGGIGVHRGFNNAVFNSEFFPVLMKCIASAKLGGACCRDDDGGTNGCADGEEDAILVSNSSAPYQLLTTGHSLGAANAVLLGAALHLAYPNENIRSVNFGCPKIGANPWMEWVNSMQPDRKSLTSSLGSYEIFRFVNKLDIIPRQPRFVLAHAGHTLQMTVGGDIKAYYDHVGDETRGYSGVPFWWEEATYALMPLSLASHSCHHYVTYLKQNKPKRAANSISYYVDEFEHTKDFERRFEPSAQNDAHNIGNSIGLLGALLLLHLYLI